jgi:hypothetical protein
VPRSDKRRHESRKKNRSTKTGFIVTPKPDPDTQELPGLLNTANVAVELYLRPMPRANGSPDRPDHQPEADHSIPEPASQSGATVQRLLPDVTPPPSWDNRARWGSARHRRDEAATT